MRRYYSIHQYYDEIFGKPVQKACLDAGFTCPNLDGHCSTGGCIFCDGGSGTFTTQGSITQQLEREALRLGKDTAKIAYFQAHTNTYASLGTLQAVYEEALAFPNIVGLSIATRPDCLQPEVIELLQAYQKKTHLTVELGLQTIHDKTAKIINRGYDFSCFQDALTSLKQANIRTCVHIINGLPQEDFQDMLETARVVGQLHPEGIKIHLLHVLKHTPLAKLYEQRNLEVLSEMDYCSLVCGQLALLPSDIVIERLTGDGEKNALLAPLWSLQKSRVINQINHWMHTLNFTQGCFIEHKKP